MRMGLLVKSHGCDNRGGRSRLEAVVTKEGVAEIINLQPIGRMAKPYQVKQARSILTKYHLGINNDE